MPLIIWIVCASPRGLYSNLLEHCYCYYLYRDMCNLFLFFIASICIFENKNGQRYHYLIVLYYFILLTEIELFLYGGKNKGIEGSVIIYIIQLCQGCLKLL